MWVLTGTTPPLYTSHQFVWFELQNDKKKPTKSCWKLTHAADNCYSNTLLGLISVVLTNPAGAVVVSAASFAANLAWSWSITLLMQASVQGQDAGADSRRLTHLRRCGWRGMPEAWVRRKTTRATGPTGHKPGCRGINSLWCSHRIFFTGDTFSSFFNSLTQFAEVLLRHT